MAKQNLTDDEQKVLEAEERQEAANAELHEALAHIFKKSISELHLDDKRFLQARRSYLDERQLEKYSSVLKEKLPRPDGQPNAQEEELIAQLTRKELEIMAERFGIEDVSDKKIFPKNADLVAVIEKKKEEERKRKEAEGK